MKWDLTKAQDMLKNKQASDGLWKKFKDSRAQSPSDPLLTLYNQLKSGSNKPAGSTTDSSSIKYISPENSSKSGMPTAPANNLAKGGKVSAKTAKSAARPAKTASKPARPKSVTKSSSASFKW